jgi:hypothetical protein
MRSSLADRLPFLAAVVAAGAIAVPARGQVPEIYFSPALNVSRSENFAQSAVLAQDADGAVYVAWDEGLGTQVFLSRSADEGRTFGPARPMMPAGFANGYLQLAVAGAGPGVVHAVAAGFGLASGGAEIVYVRTSDGGTTFTPPVLISQDDDFTSYVPSIAAGWSVAVAWGDSPRDTGVNGIRYSQSLDGGATFSAPRPLSAPPPVGFQGCPSVALAGTTAAYVAWAAGFDDVDRIIFTRSIDAGSTFSPPIAISREPPQRTWCPRMVVDGAGTISVFWAEGPAFERRVVFVRSTDGGLTFSSPSVVSDPAPDVEDPRPAVADDGTVFVSWRAGDLDAGYRCRLATVSPSGAVSLAGEPPYCGEMDARSPGALHVAWHQTLPGDQYSNVFHSRGDIRPPNVPRSFHAVRPCRLVDTRSTDGPALLANRSRTFAVAPHCDIPIDAVAVAVNMTVVGPTDVGNLRAYGAGGLLPRTSVINFVPGRTRANNAIIPVGIFASVTVQCDMPAASVGSTHFVLDAYGYYR